jgi:hypothetical protein
MKIARARASDEVVAERMARRATRNYSKVAVTPVPVSLYGASVNDTIRYMFPASGTLSDIKIHIDTIGKKGAKITISTETSDQVTAQSVITKKQSLSLTSEIEVSAKDRFSMVVEAIDPEETVEGIWLAFSFIPNEITAVKESLDAQET